MIDHRNDLAEQNASARRLLPVPVSAACVRAVIHLAAREHVYAERARKSGQSQPSRRYKPRTDRLTRVALRAEARADDLRAEAR